MVERCVCCGAYIPEGRQVCPICEAKESKGGSIMEDIVKFDPSTFNEESQKQKEYASKLTNAINLILAADDRILNIFKTMIQAELDRRFEKENQNGIN